jgi:fibronectin-binding autotransporter adhesin
MNRRIASLGLVSLLACGAQAQITSTWNKITAATHSWTDAANWNNGVPNAAGDVALVTTLTALYATQTINLNLPLTLGRLDLLNQWYASRIIAPNGGSLTFNSAGGNATFNHANIYRLDTFGAPITLNTNLVLNSYSRSEFGYGGAVPGQGLNITNSIDGPGGVIKTGSGMVWLSNINNPFGGSLAIEQGWLYAAHLASLGASSSAIPMGSAGRLGGLLWGGAQVFTRELALTGAGARLTPVSTLNLGNVVSGPGALMVLGGYRSATVSVNFTNAADNTYAGPTLAASGRIEANVANRVIPGDVAVTYGGRLTLQAANNVGGTVEVLSRDLGAPVVSLLSYVRVKSDFVPTLSTNASGVFEWVGNSGPNLNAALAAGPLGGGYMAYGGGGTYTGDALAPNLDNVYRFAMQADGGYPGGNVTLNRAGSVGVLTGNRSVVVSAPTVLGQWSMGNGLILSDANDFTGSLTVHPGSWVRGYAQTAVGASPFGHATGAVHLAGGYLDLQGVSGGQAVSKGALTIRGQTLLSLNAAGTYPTALSFASLSRLERASLAITAQQNSMGSNETVKIVSGAPVNDAQGMVAPWMVEYYGSSFLSYDSTTGFAKRAFTSTDLSTAGATDIVNAPGGAISGARTVHALRTTGVLSSAGPGDVLTIGSGGLILINSGSTLYHSANIDFGSAEGVLHIASVAGTPRTHVFSGKFTGGNGLTIGSFFVGNGCPSVMMTSSVPSTISGTLTINQGFVACNSNSLAGFTNIVINGSRPADSGNAQTSAFRPHGGNLTIPSGVTITVGQEGGMVHNAYGSEGNLTIDGRITGGTLIIGSEHAGRSITMNSALNDYTGGTYVIGGPTLVGVNGKMGTGDVIIGGSEGNRRAMLYLYGTDNIHDSARVILASLNYGEANGLALQAAGETIGSLEGSGTVFFNRAGGSVLTLGGNNASTEFYGSFSDYYLSPGVTTYTGTVVKVGSGTFTLWGEGRHGGGTRVEQGTFRVNGALDTGVRVEAAGTLDGTGAVGPVINNGGTVGGSLTMTSLVLGSGSKVAAALNGTTPVSGYSQLTVQSAVNLNNSTLQLTLGFAPEVGQTFTILNGTAVSGQFASGSTITATYGGKAYPFSITNTGDAVVLKSLAQGSVFTIK